MLTPYALRLLARREGRYILTPLAYKMIEDCKTRRRNPANMMSDPHQKKAFFAGIGFEDGLKEIGAGCFIKTTKPPTI
jgi:hypothetical protein